LPPPLLLLRFHSTAGLARQGNWGGAKSAPGVGNALLGELHLPGNWRRSKGQGFDPLIHLPHWTQEVVQVEVGSSIWWDTPTWNIAPPEAVFDIKFFTKASALFSVW
jgi:hypothetical protein